MNLLFFLWSAFISIPPLLGWKKDPDLSWFEELKEYQQVKNIIHENEIFQFVFINLCFKIKIVDWIPKWLAMHDMHTYAKLFKNQNMLTRIKIFLTTSLWTICTKTLGMMIFQILHNLWKMQCFLNARSGDLVL